LSWSFFFTGAYAAGTGVVASTEGILGGDISALVGIIYPLSDTFTFSVVGLLSLSY